MKNWLNFLKEIFPVALMALGIFGTPVLAIAAWLTHVIMTIKAGAYVLLLAGSLVFPVGIIHGVMIWFGHGWA